MDADLIRSARLSAAKRHHALQFSQHQWDYLSVDESEIDEEFPCPYCYEDFDIVTLCYHMEEEHMYDSKVLVCPVCAAKIQKDMVGHMTAQHGHLFKIQRRHRFRRTGIPIGSLLGVDYREAHLQALHGGVSLRNSSAAMANATDSLLSALANNFDSEDLPKQNQGVDMIPTKALPSSKHKKASSKVPLSIEEHEREWKQATLRATFVQQLVLSTIVDDN